MVGQKTLTPEEFNRLPQDQRLLIRAQTKLVKHFRGLESANLITQEQTAEYIGYVKDLVRLATQGIEMPLGGLTNGHMEGSTVSGY